MFQRVTRWGAGWLAAGWMLVLALPGAAEAQIFYGPLGLREMSPFSFWRLDMAPIAHADRAFAEGWHFGTELALGNSMIFSENIEGALRDRGERLPIRAQDLAAIDALPGDVVYFDGETAIARFTARYGFGEHWSAYVTAPVHYYSGGGFMDNVIDEFHDTFGFDSNGRDLVARDQLQSIVRVDDASATLLRGDDDLGLADPVLGARYRFTDLGPWHIALGAAVTVPLDTVGDFYERERPDVGVQASIQRELGKQSLYLELAHTWAGGPEVLDGATNATIPRVTFAFERQFGADSTAVLQLTSTETMFDNAGTERLSEGMHFLSAGWRERFGDTLWTLALRENLVNFKNSADISLHVQIEWGAGID